MSVISGPNLNKSGLILHLDALNKSSFRGEPTTNLLNPSNNSVNTYHPNYRPISNSVPGSIAHGSISLATNEVAPPINGLNVYKISDDGVDTQNVRISLRFHSENFLQYNKTYTYSCWIYLPSNFAGRYTGMTNAMYQNTNGNDWHATIGYDSTYNYYSAGPIKISENNININTYDRWQRFSMTFSPLSTNKNLAVNNGNDNNLWSSGYFRVNVSNAVNGGTPYFFYITDAQLEESTYPKSFTFNTRGTTFETGGGWADLSGNKIHGELMGGVGESTDGRKSLFFNGQDNYISLGNSSILDNVLNGATNWTICYWIKYTGEGRVLDAGNINSDPGGALELNPRVSSINNNGLNPGGTSLVSVNFNSTRWNFITLTKDSSRVHSWFLNGIFSNSATETLDYSVSNQTWKIGRRALNTTSHKLVGHIAVIKIYNRILPPDEILQNYNALKGRFIST